MRIYRPLKMSAQLMVDRDRDEYSRRMQFEHQLIDRRITWLLSSQAILFAAYGLAIDKSDQVFLDITAFTGGAIAAFIFIGIVANFAAKWHIWQDFKNPKHPNEPFWVRTWITYTSFLCTEFFLPLLFIYAWAMIYFFGLNKP